MFNNVYYDRSKFDEKLSNNDCDLLFLVAATIHAWRIICGLDCACRVSVITYITERHRKCINFQSDLQKAIFHVIVQYSMDMYTA